MKQHNEKAQNRSVAKERKKQRRNNNQTSKDETTTNWLKKLEANNLKPVKKFSNRGKVKLGKQRKTRKKNMNEVNNPRPKNNPTQRRSHITLQNAPMILITTQPPPC